ncbi:MAG: amidohydrolase [Pseudomonadota bacterium]|nr:amidohydrolase [Pseudomonadota bacterium]
MRGLRSVAGAVVTALCAMVAMPAFAQQVTVLTASRIDTMDAAVPRAQAMAYDADGKILALGSHDALLARYPDAKRLDVGDATVVPGLIDAHGHMLGLGMARLTADLVGTSSKEEIIKRLRAFSATLPADAWLIGRGWDQNDWPQKQFPTAADLDAAFPDRPVWLSRIDGHAGWANTAAMRAVERDLSGQSASEGWQPDGGRIVRDAKGQATGVFVDEAMGLVYAVVPDASEETIERALKLAMDDAVAHGLTGVHDAGVSLGELRIMQRLADAGEMPMRITAMADGNGKALEWLCQEGLYQHPSQRLRMRSVKLYIDGALGSRGAAMLEEYSDDHGNLGLLVMTPAQLGEAVAKAQRCRVQVATHAIGDRGNREVLDAYATALGARATASDHRWRIEHAQIIAPDDLPRLARMHVIASMQPTHATSDMPWAEDRVGPSRINGAYAWRKLRDSGARLALGSDFPVESVDPRLGLYAAATRTDAAGMPAGGWHPEDKLTAYEALRGFTLDAAYAGFAEAEVGSLAPGKRADFVVLAEDPLAIDPSGLKDLTVRATYVDGEAVYEAP